MSAFNLEYWIVRNEEDIRLNIEIGSERNDYHEPPTLYVDSAHNAETGAPVELTCAETRQVIDDAWSRMGVGR